MAYSAITILNSVKASATFLQGGRKLTVNSGLYQGYKRRNARLDALKPPKYLGNSPLPLANQTLAISSQKRRCASFTTTFYSSTDCLPESLVLANSTTANSSRWTWTTGINTT